MHSLIGRQRHQELQVSPGCVSVGPAPFSDLGPPPGNLGWCRGEGSKTVRPGGMEGSLHLLPRSSKDCLPPSLCFSRKWNPVEEKRPCENISMNLCHSSRGTQPFGEASGLGRRQGEDGPPLAAQDPQLPGACWFRSQRTLARL